MGPWVFIAWILLTHFSVPTLSFSLVVNSFFPESLLIMHSKNCSYRIAQDLQHCKLFSFGLIKLDWWKKKLCSACYSAQNSSGPWNIYSPSSFSAQTSDLRMNCNLSNLFSFTNQLSSLSKQIFRKQAFRLARVHCRWLSSQCLLSESFS